MVLLRFGLYVSVGLAVLATWLSSSAGYPAEVALLRGLLAFMAGSLVAYVAELIVMTAPPVVRQSTRPRATEAHDAEIDEYEPNEPVSLPAIRAERDAAVDDSRAA
ncbi:MAG: hypothetical protein AB7F65_08945 [Dehalococcoidia bacterium]